jgi:hypothetical protein
MEILSDQSFDQLAAFIACSRAALSNSTGDSHPAYFYLPYKLVIDTRSFPIELVWDNPKLPQHFLDIRDWVHKHRDKLQDSASSPATMAAEILATSSIAPEMTVSASIPNLKTSPRTVRVDSLPIQGSSASHAIDKKPSLIDDKLIDSLIKNIRAQWKKFPSSDSPTETNAVGVDLDWKQISEQAAANALSMKRRRKTSNMKAELDRERASADTRSSTSAELTNHGEDWAACLLQAAANAKNVTDTSQGSKRKYRNIKSVTAKRKRIEEELKTSAAIADVDVDSRELHSQEIAHVMDKVRRDSALKIVTNHVDLSSNDRHSSSSSHSVEIELRSMHTTLLAEVLSSPQPTQHLYCHRGCCEHRIELVHARQHHSSCDPPATSEYYPRSLSQDNRAIATCEVCDLLPAAFATFDDPLTKHSPTYLCE